MKLLITVLTFSVFVVSQLQAQKTEKKYTQVIRGTVVDKQTQIPLPGANIILLNSDPVKGTTTDSNGDFRLRDIPIGRQGVLVSFIGYHTTTAKNLIISSAKEMVLYIEMEEKVETTEEVIVVGNIRKDLAMNKMASVSARAFTVEEAGRYAGSREDVARMATNFAGVSGANDQRNDIVVRGNTPSGILWRLEDVDIPNPNHFAASGTTGGPIGMLNNNTLRNSDFYTSAFPAEYTNVFSGTFDLKMRDGNNENYEFLGQVGFNGFELGTEGPFKKNGKSSFLANYRYSTLKVFDLMGINVGTSGIPEYQDLSFKMNFPLKKGKISWFGLAGDSNISILDSEITDSDIYVNDGMDLINGSSMFVSGLNFTRFHSNNTYSKFIISYLNQSATTEIDEVEEQQPVQPFYRENNGEDRLSLNYIFNSRINRRLSVRSGVTADRFGYSLDTKVWEYDKNDWEYLVRNNKPIPDGPNLYRGYSQILFKFSDRFEIKPGLSVMYFGLNNSSSLEPRFGANWKTGERTSLNFGYGKHSKVQSMITYFLETYTDQGDIILTNTDLDFTKTHHFVVGFDALLGEQLRFKAESYYQYLFDVPVEITPSSFSILNQGAEWGLNTRDSLINEGEGWNYGLEFTLEKFYHRNYYFLTTLSLFDSKYKGSDGIKRNTAFNGNFVFNALAGKEIPIKNNMALVFDVKVSWAGGKRYTPIDLEASRNSDGPFPTEYKEELAYSEQFNNYFKADLKIGFRLNEKRVSQTLEIYLENITNHKNALSQSYSRTDDKVKTTYQLGFLPLMNYRIYF